MKKYEYKQAVYYDYPTIKELNEQGEYSWEVVDIHQYKIKIYDDITKERYKVTFKREIDEH